MAQPRGPPKNDVIHEQEVGVDNAKIIAKEYGEINVIYGDWLLVQRKKYNKIVTYGQGKSLSNNAPRDLGSSKIKGIDVFLKTISVDSKTTKPTLDARQLTREGGFTLQGQLCHFGTTSCYEWTFAQNWANI